MQLAGKGRRIVLRLSCKRCAAAAKLIEMCPNPRILNGRQLPVVLGLLLACSAAGCAPNDFTPQVLQAYISPSPPSTEVPHKSAYSPAPRFPFPAGNADLLRPVGSSDTLNFASPVDAATLEVTSMSLLELGVGPVPGTVALSSTRAIFKPERPMSVNALHMLSLTQGITMSRGRLIRYQYRRFFWSGDTLQQSGNHPPS